MPNQNDAMGGGELLAPGEMPQPGGMQPPRPPAEPQSTGRIPPNLPAIPPAGQTVPNALAKLATWIRTAQGQGTTTGAQDDWLAEYELLHPRGGPPAAARQEQSATSAMLAMFNQSSQVNSAAQAAGQPPPALNHLFAREEGRRLDALVDRVIEMSREQRVHTDTVLGRVERMLDSYEKRAEAGDNLQVRAMAEIRKAMFAQGLNSQQVILMEAEKKANEIIGQAQEAAGNAEPVGPVKLAEKSLAPLLPFVMLKLLPYLGIPEGQVKVMQQHLAAQTFGMAPQAVVQQVPTPQAAQAPRPVPAVAPPAPPPQLQASAASTPPAKPAAPAKPAPAAPKTARNASPPPKKRR